MIEKSMLTIKDMYQACRQYKKLHTAGTPKLKKSKKNKENIEEKNPRYDIRSRARSGIRLWRKKVIEDEDTDGDIYRKVTCSASDSNGSGREHTLEMLFFGPGTNANTRAAANCSCEFYLYACEVALWQEGSARLEEPIEMRIWSNGEGYTDGGPNPQAVPIICKHIYAALLSGAATWKPRGMSIENRRKMEFKEKKKAEREQKELRRLERVKKEERHKKTKTKQMEKVKKAAEKRTEKTIKKPPAPPAPKNIAKPPTTKWTRKK